MHRVARLCGSTGVVRSRACGRQVRALARPLPEDGRTLADFLVEGRQNIVIDESKPHFEPLQPALVAKLHTTTASEAPKLYWLETYGCQMNVSDTEIVRALLKKDGWQSAESVEEATLVLLNTCAIRENAEQRIWNRLDELRALKRKRRMHFRKRGGDPRLMVGVLGCMAERLKMRLLESDKSVDMVVGPDSYRDLPRLVSEVFNTGVAALNTQLSLDETYADITPVREGNNGVSAFVSVMRGCNNMCTYCIVPWTRGRERSRDPDSIEREVRELANMGYREIVLLGQNVNSYNYVDEEHLLKDDTVSTVDGFSTVYKAPRRGIQFAELVRRVARADRRVRVRFTSPHPKDFPDELLQVIAEEPNVCKSLHLPAQSGNTECLDRMGRGYSREAYLKLATHIRQVIPDVTLSSDFISGFCGETEEEHQDTLTLFDAVQFEHAYMFHYSMREKTKAHRRYKDDVPLDVKKRRLGEVIERYRENKLRRLKAQGGKIHLVLLDREARKWLSKDSDIKVRQLYGRSDNNFSVIIEVPDDLQVPVFAHNGTHNESTNESRMPQIGDFVAVRIREAPSGLTLRGDVMGISDSPIFCADEWEHLLPL
ncbi:MAG: hypothetical protein MHM6MM_003543 [Cercozoa sp. M6MM]